MPEAYGLTASESWYPHYFNTEENLNYIGPIHDTEYYGVNDMGEEKRQDFLAWNDRQKSDLFDIRRGLKIYCQDDVTGLRQECRVLDANSRKLGT